MLPSELLRARIFQRKNIQVLFANINEENLFIADSLIKVYEESIGKKLKWLEEEVAEIERMSEDFGYDFKFFRGLKTLLDRRLEFKENIDIINSIKIRNEIFETCNKLFGGFILNKKEKEIVLKEVSKKLNLDFNYINKVFNAIYEEEKEIKNFEKIKGEDLLKLYNLSLVQTLLFRCKKMFVDLNARGSDIREFLWKIKRLGLLYLAEKSYYGINLAIDGPVSVLRQIERYGTKLARAFPLILPFKYWKIRAYISEKLRAKKRKSRIFKFEISKEKEYLFPKIKPKEITFDSEIEEEFAKRFVSSEGEWQLIREPEPLIVENSIFIPDFILIKENKKVYFEIVGFWTEDYLKRKVEKLSKLKDVNIIVAIDSSLGKFEIDSSNIQIIKFNKKLSTVDIIKALRKF